jgi:lysophospholipase L1-like esterase
MSVEQIIKNWRFEQERALRVIAFGSSNTELHWHSLGHFNWFSWLSSSMREWIGKHITTINQGIGGETVVDLVKRYDRDVRAFEPDLVVITIGGNDTWKGISIEEYEQKLKFLINDLTEINAIPVLQTYYCLLYDSMPEIFQRFPKFVDVNRKLAKKENVFLIDQYKFFSPFYEEDSESYSKIMLDGLHVNQIGNALMGIIACRSLGLPDPIFMKDKKEYRGYLKIMGKYSSLPPRNPKKEWQ